MNAHIIIRMWLDDFSFTNNADNAISETKGWSSYDDTIDALSGDDTIAGKSDRSDGISVDDGAINTGDGNDTITGIGNDAGIQLFYGNINTGNGNDTITGAGKYVGIDFYKSTINTGNGNDTVDALEGGFSGYNSNDKVYLGAGNDSLKGFGDGNFYGETGKDKIFFDAGKYRISGTSVKYGDENMKVYEFEKIGGISGGLFNFKDGTLTVDSKGVGTFA